MFGLIGVRLVALTGSGLALVACSPRPTIAEPFLEVVRSHKSLNNPACRYGPSTDHFHQVGAGLALTGRSTSWSRSTFRCRFPRGSRCHATPRTADSQSRPQQRQTTSCRH